MENRDPLEFIPNERNFDLYAFVDLSSDSELRGKKSFLEK